MKKLHLISILLFSLIHTSVSAAEDWDYYCFDTYFDKVEKIERNPKMRRAGQIAAGVVPGLLIGAGTLGLAFAFAPLAPGLALILLFPVTPAAPIYTPLFVWKSLEHRDQEMVNSYYFLENLDKLKPSSTYTVIDMILDKYKMQKTQDEDWNEFVDRYAHLSREEQFFGLKELLMRKAQTDEFCPKGRALPFKKLIKNLEN